MYALPLVGGSTHGTMWVGTWNMSHWRATKARAMFCEVAANVLTIQKTYFTTVPLQWVPRTMHDVGGHINHGHLVSAVVAGNFGRSCVVGFLMRPGVAVILVLQVVASKRWLHVVG